MRIAEISITRPVLAIVVNLMLILLGLVCYDRLSVREYPNIDVPEVTVETRYPGADARIMESQVTKPLEDSLSGIEGIDFIRSISRAENSQITVRFKLERDPDAAAADVRDRVGRVRQALPEEIDEPIVAKVEADAQPIIWLALSSDHHSAMETSEKADLVVKDKLQTIPGVASVRIFGERRFSMRIWLNRERMAAYNLTTLDVENALRAQNVEIPSGRIESVQREFTVLTQTDLNTPEQFNEIIIKNTDQSYLVRMKDVARVELAPQEERQITRFNNKQSIALGVIKQSTANPLQISSAIRNALPEFDKLLPNGMKLQVAYDSSVFIDQSLKSVFKTIAEAVLLVVLVIYLFLRNFRATTIPLVTIPISLIGTLAIMYWLNFSINTLTLLSMVIAVGLVVDDAIVVLENTYRHIENGMDSLHAAVKSAREISFAVLAMTMTLVAVFAPIAFTPGRTGKLFVEFALTLAAAVAVSGITALTLTPMMCSRMLKHEESRPNHWTGKVERFLNRMEVGYRRVLSNVIAARKWVFASAGLLVILMAGLFLSSPSELAPAEDRGVVFAVTVAPEGSTVQYSDGYAKQVEKILQSQPEAAWNFMAIGFPQITQSFGVLGLKPWNERDVKSMDIVGKVSPQLFGIPGVLAFGINPPSLGQRGTSRPVEFVVQTTGTYEDLNAINDKVMAKLRTNPVFIMPDSDLKLNKPEVRVQVNRDKLASLGIQVSEVGRTLETMLGGREVTRFKRSGQQYDVVVKIEDKDRTSPNDLSNIYVRSKSGQMVPLSNVVSFEESVAPRELNRFNKLRAATIQANLVPGYPLGLALEFMEKTIKEVAPEANFDYGGVSREYKESSGGMGLLFGLALGFIFLVLAGQFESFRDPAVILVSVPLALTGALVAMRFTGGSLNVYSQIGLVALIGLISKHGILMVEFANQLQERGTAMLDAIIEASTLRLRPILMTTAATILGALPLAIATGAGAESRQAIGWIIVGGMSFGTLMTLFVVPCFYLLISKPRHLVQIDESKLQA